MMIRDIPPLSVTILKEIARNPTKYVSSIGYERSQRIHVAGFDSVQILVNYVIEAGRLTDDSLPVSIFANRTVLSLKNSKISAAYLKSIVSQMPNLKELDLSGTFMVDDDAILSIFQICPLLTKLGVQNCRKLTNLSLDYIARNANHLVALQLGGNFNISADGLLQYLQSKRVENIVELHVSGLALTDSVVLAIAKKCPRLTKIGLNYCNVTEPALRTLFDTVGVQLDSVSIAWMGSAADRPEYQISTDFVSEYLSHACPRLLDLDVSGLRNVNASCLMAFLDNKMHQMDVVGFADSVPLKSLKAKYIGSSKPQLEQTVCLSHSYVKVTL